MGQVTSLTWQSGTRPRAACPRAVRGWHADGTGPPPFRSSPHRCAPQPAAANTVPARFPFLSGDHCHTPDHLPAWALTPNIPVPYCPRARHQTTRDNSYAPEPLNLLLKPADPKAAQPASLVPS